MPSAAGIALRMARRVAESPFSLTIHYPAKRATVVDTSPGAAPLRPLTGTRPAPKLVTPAEEPDPTLPSVTMPCLWLDATRISDLTGTAQRAKLQGWVAGAEVMATVLASDAAVVPELPEGDTKFDGADYVEKDGLRYLVLAVTPIGASFAPAHSYAVWLRGATKQ